MLPQSLARVSARGSPVRITIFTAVVVAVIAGIFPLDEIAALANAGTLAAFVAVCSAMLVLRRREPGRERKFRMPLAWVLGPIVIVGCLYLFWSLPVKTQTYFLAWNVVGLLVYALYASHQAARVRAASQRA
jgi:APA family basic amino acid/polyamine antiporter